MSDTNKPGPVKRFRFRHPRLLLGLGIIVAVIAVYIGVQGIGILYSIVFPAMPPVPEGVHEVRHDSTEHGFDTWVYSSDQDACAVLNFYREHGTGCVVMPSACGSADATMPQSARNQSVGQCQGQETFSIFSMSWNAMISTGDASTRKTTFRLEREVYWTGAEIRPTPEFPSK